MSEFAQLRVWIVHDWLTGMRGGERVLLELVRIFPQARIATLIHVPASVDPEIEARVRRVSFLNRLPAIGKYYRNLLPLFPAAIHQMSLDDAEGCDLVISSSHCVAKAIRIPAGAAHLCYSHGFLRYVWDMQDAYVGRNPLKTAALAALRPALRRFDRQNKDVQAFIANSHHEAARIRKFYLRDSEVVYPGVDTDWYVPIDETRESSRPAPACPFYLVVAALVPFKRIDLAVQAFAPQGPLHGRQLAILGTGPEESRLKKLAGAALNQTIHFKGWADREPVRWHYQHCQALLFPGEEHFGMTAVECQACGRPVVALSRGGVGETVVGLQTSASGRRAQDAAGPATGLFFNEPTVEALSAAVRQFENAAGTFEPAAIRNNALRFGWPRFRAGIHAAVSRLIAGDPTPPPRRDPLPP